MSTTGHLNVKQGKVVLAIMKDGNHFKARFKEHKGKYLYFFDHASVTTSEVRTLSLYQANNQRGIDSSIRGMVR